MKRTLTLVMLCILLLATVVPTVALAAKPITPTYKFQYKFDVYHGSTVAGQIVIKQASSSTVTTFTVSVKGINPGARHWLYYTTPSGEIKYVGTAVSTKTGTLSMTGTWTNALDDLTTTPAPRFTLNDAKQATTLTLTVSNAKPGINNEVTFTATPSVPLSDQSVSIVDQNGNAVPMQGSGSTYTWKKSWAATGDYAYYAVSSGDEGFLGASSNIVKIGVAVLPTPQLVSPEEGAVFHNWPRTTVLVWQTVEGADSYLVEREYLLLTGEWWSYDLVTVPEADTWGGYGDYTFNFLGMAPGRWRITALDSADTSKNSLPSDWRYFEYEV